MTTQAYIKPDKSKLSKYDFSFYLLLFFLFLDYVRPQSGILPAVGYLRIPMIIIVVLTLKGIMNNKWKFDDPVTKAFIIILVLCGIHIPLATNNFYAYQMTRSLLIYFLTFMAIKSYVNSDDKLRTFLNFWLLIGVVCSVRGLAGGGKIPGSGFLGDENDFSLYLTMMIPIAYVNILRAGTNKIYNIIAIILLLAGVVSSFSRGGLVGLVGVLFYCFIITPKKKYFIIAMLAGLVCAAPYISTKYKAEMATIFEGSEESTAGERLYLWGVGLKMFYDNPILGVGPGNFPWRVAEYEPVERYKGRGHGGRPAHSLYFTLIPELGLIGTVCFFVMIISPYKRFRRVYKNNYSNRYQNNNMVPINIEVISQYKTLYGILFGYLFSGIFLSVFYYPHFWIVSGLMSSLEKISNTREF